jgi:hypothetical protein
VHLPDLLTVKGIVAAQRFRLPDDGPAIASTSGASAFARYLALYELDTDGVASVRAAVSALRLVELGRGFDGLEVLASMTGTALGECQTTAPVRQAGTGGEDRWAPSRHVWRPLVRLDAPLAIAVSSETLECVGSIASGGCDG